MLAGFILLITAHSHALPLTDKIYPTRAECEQAKTRILERRLNVALECGEVLEKQ